MRARRLAATLASMAVAAQLLLMAFGGSQAAGGLAGFKFIGSVDTMKLSKDQASGGFTSDDAQSVDLAASMAVTHITVDTPLEYPSAMVAWAERIHKDGKHVWFRLGSVNGGSLAHSDSSKASGYKPPYDGYPGFGPGYLTTLHQLMLAHPGSCARATSSTAIPRSRTAPGGRPTTAARCSNGAPPVRKSLP